MKSRKIKHMTRALVAAALLASTTGCYALGLNAQGMAKPVSMTANVGRASKVVRHFKHNMVTWYGFGLIPLATVPGPVPTWTPADKLVVKLLQDELAKGGDGVANLRVVQQYNIISIVAMIIPNFIPVVGSLITLAVQPIDVIVEGDIVSFSGRAAGPMPGVVTEHNGEVDLGGLDIRAMVAKTVREAQAQAK